MRLAVTLSAVILGSLVVSNVDCTFHLLGSLLFGGGRHPPPPESHHVIPGFRLFDEFFNIFHRIFGGTRHSFNGFLDGCIRGIPTLFNDLLGVEKIHKFLGPLSRIPDDANLASLLNDKFKAKADIIGFLIQLAKKFCNTGKCDETNGEKNGNSKIGGSEDELKKLLEQFLSGFNDKIESGLNRFTSGFEELIVSLANGKNTEIFEMLTKLPDDIDLNDILGKKGSRPIDDLLSRKDILDILRKFAKSKCSSGCENSETKPEEKKDS